MTTDICDCQEAPEFQSTTWSGPVCSRCGKKMTLSRQVGEIRKVIDQFELWKCGDDADGYNVSADHLATIIANHSSVGASLIGSMTDEEFNRDRSGENPNAGELTPAKDGREAQVRGPCIPVTYCGLATSTHVPLGSDEDHCDLCGHPAEPFATPPAQPARWAPPPAASRPDGFECLIWHRGRWRHVSWAAVHRGWMFGYASAHTMDTPERLYAPLPNGTPDNDFWQGEKS